MIIPLSTHVNTDTNEEVEDYQLVRVSVVYHLSSDSNRIEVHTIALEDCNSTRNDVVTIEVNQQLAHGSRRYRQEEQQ